MLANFKKYKLQSSALLLLTVVPLIVLGVLASTLGLGALGAFLFPVIIVALAASVTAFSGLVSIAVNPKIEKRRIKVEKEFFQEWDKAANNKYRDPYWALKDLKGSIRPLFGILAPTEKQIKNYLEKKSEDALGNTYLHKTILLEDKQRAKSILDFIYEFFPVNWNVVNNDGQTLLHIAAEKNDPDFLNLFLNNKDKNFRFDLNIEDSKNKTAINITEDKKAGGVNVSNSFDELYERYKFQGSDLLLNDSNKSENPIKEIIRKINKMRNSNSLFYNDKQGSKYGSIV